MAKRSPGLRGTISRRLAPHHGVVLGLSLAFLALLPFGGLYNVPLLALCGLGLLRLASRPREALDDVGMRLLLVLFLCIWLPMAVSAVDAVNPVAAWRKVLGFPVFFLAGACVVMALRRMTDLRRLLAGVLIICTLWGVDASLQLMLGFNLLGFPHEGGRLSGIFHPDLKLGVVLATVAPFVFEAVRGFAGRRTWVVLTLVPFFATIVLSGNRSSWIMLLVALVGYGWYLLRWAGEPMVRGRVVVRMMAVGVLACGVLAYAFPQAAGQARGLLAERVDPVVGLMNGDHDKADKAIVARLSAWESACRVFRAHWINGVGPRGFREVHPEYAPAHDPYVQSGRTLTYPHLLVLEVAAETGLVGLLGYLVALAVLVHRLRALTRPQLASGFPYWLAIVIVLFPFVTHLSFYAHFMGALIWWTIAISAAGLGAAARCEPGDRLSRA